MIDGTMMIEALRKAVAIKGADYRYSPDPHLYHRTLDRDNNGCAYGMLPKKDAPIEEAIPSCGVGYAISLIDRSMFEEIWNAYQGIVEVVADLGLPFDDLAVRVANEFQYFQDTNDPDTNRKRHTWGRALEEAEVVYLRG